MRIVVGITGASGAVLGQRLLHHLQDWEVHLVVSDAARRVIALELGDVVLPATAHYDNDQLDAPIASSSFPVEAMVVVPCSLRTLSGIAQGYSENLILRAAENVLRMGRRLVVVPRETPLSLAAIENMRKVRQAGGIILPPIIAYYFKPQTVDDITDFLVGKILDVLGIDHRLYRRWGSGLD